MQQLVIPPTAEGETYSGAIGNKSGDVYHLTVITINNERATQEEQLAWAKSVGGDLPNKLEYAMLFAHNKELFQLEAYWSNETFVDPDNPEDTAYAWYQGFGYGGQVSYRESLKLRGVAVRRLPI